MNSIITFEGMCERITKTMSVNLNNGHATVKIENIEPNQPEDSPLGLYVNGVLVFKSEMGTYTECSEMLITYMNSY